MKKEILIENIEKLTSKEKEILGQVFKNKGDIDLAELIKNIKDCLKDGKDKEIYNKLLNRLTEFNKNVNQESEKWWKFRATISC